jgi:hypothetical protein
MCDTLLVSKYYGINNIVHAGRRCLKKGPLSNPGYQAAVLPPRLNSKYAQPEVQVLMADCPVESTL